MAEQFYFLNSHEPRSVVLVAQRTAHHTPKWELIGAAEDRVYFPAKVLVRGVYISPGPFTTQKNALQFAKLHGHKAAVRDRKGRVEFGEAQQASRFTTTPHE